MKKSLNILFALLLVSGISFGQQVPADSIFSKFYKATGGKALWDGVKTMNLKRNYSAASAAPYEANVTVSLPDKSISKSKTIMKRSFVYTVKGDQGWIKVPVGQRVDVKDLSQAEQQNMRLEMYELFAPFIDYKNRGLIATTVGIETLNSVPVTQVELEGRGVKYNLYFDSKTGLLQRVRKNAAGVETTTDFSNYVKSGYGISYPSKAVEINSLDKKPVTVVSTATINGQVSPELFKR
jgi:putative salt-induced outer membrane protein